jgi:hypothetical protein
MTDEIISGCVGFKASTLCNGNMVDSGVAGGEGDFCGLSGRQSAGGSKIEDKNEHFKRQNPFSALNKF